MILYSCILKYNLLNMATIAQDDTSDLLILSDETDTIKSDENPIIEENTSSMDDLITFDTDEIIKEETWLDMWLDLWTTEAKPEMESKEKVSNTVFSLEEATAWYIAQLEARKDQIASNIESDEKIISIKEEKIKDLRSEIADYRKSIKTLNSENDEIDNKIWLVSWKNKAADIKSTTSTKVHNVKRKKAA